MKRYIFQMIVVMLLISTWAFSKCYQWDAGSFSDMSAWYPTEVTCEGQGYIWFSEDDNSCDDINLSSTSGSIGSLGLISAGSSNSLTWNNFTTSSGFNIGLVNIQLYHENELIYNYLSGVPNGLGTYGWQVDFLDSLPTSTCYHFVIRDYYDDDYYIAGQYFTISNPSDPCGDGVCNGAAEYYYDSNGNGIYDAGEIFTDSNGNGICDLGENTTTCPVDCAEDNCPDCVDDDGEVSPIGCATAVATFGCDYTWGDILVSDACPVTCGTCPTIPDGDCDCDGNVDDCNGECGGDAIVDDCGVCEGENADDLGCGCFEPAPSGCDNTCGSNYEYDICGLCAGTGLDEDGCCHWIDYEHSSNPDLFGYADCFGVCGGNAADLGCGCDEPAPSGCDNACDSDLEFDECGVCGGDDSACTGCTDEYGLNYNLDATIDDGSCEYYEGEVSTEEPHVYWEFNTGPVSDEDYYDEHIYSWPLYYAEEGDACVDIPEQNYYICLAEINENTCGSSSLKDLAFIKIDYNGQEIERNYICDFNSEYQYDDKARAIAYRNNSLYIVMYTRLIADNYPDLNETGLLTGDYLIKFDLDGNKEWIRRFDECNDCNYAQFRDLDVDIDGNAVVLAKAVNVTLNGANGIDATYISKYSTLGDLEWVSLHHIAHEYMSSDCDPNSYTGRLNDIYIDENNELFFVGEGECNGAFPMLGKADVSNGNILWAKNLRDENILLNGTYLKTVSILPNGNIFVGGNSSGYSAMGITDSNGNGISYRMITECYNEPIYICSSNIYDSVVTPKMGTNRWELPQKNQS